MPMKAHKRETETSPQRHYSYPCFLHSFHLISLQALAPKAKELQAKYGENRALLNQLMAKLYHEAKVNPLAGCLPALVQIPIFIALYRSLVNLATENTLNEAFLWIPRYDLKQMLLREKITSLKKDTSRL